ncbi:MAG: hypothetical protein ABEH59_12705 [Halobacteriales archaeon]
MAEPAGEAVYIAGDLLEALCELAAERDPDRVSVPLGVTQSDQLEGAERAEGAVFTHFYLPDTGRSVRAVFGVDLGTPSGFTPGIFLGHPDGRRELTKRDELRQVCFVSVPPWAPTEVDAFDRRGRRRPLQVLDVTLPEESVP